MADLDINEPVHKERRPLVNRDRHRLCEVCGLYGVDELWRCTGCRVTQGECTCALEDED